MQPFAHIIKVSIPEYLAGLPIPDTIGGWFRLGFKDWLALVPPTALTAGTGYVLYRAFCPQAQLGCRGTSKVNLSINKKEDKVVDSIDVEDISEKAVFCRCWRSKNWPYCDGAHNDHNKNAKDNVGPLIVKKSK